MTEVSHNALIYKNMIYSFEEDQNTGTCYIVFYPGSESRFKLKIPLNSFHQYTLEEIVIKKNKEYAEFNVMNLYALIVGSKVEIHSVFLTYDQHDNPAVRISMFGDSLSDTKKHTKPVILDFDIATGVSIAYLTQQPICMVKSEFEAKCST